MKLPQRKIKNPYAGSNPDTWIFLARHKGLVAGLPFGGSYVFFLKRQLILIRGAFLLRKNSEGYESFRESIIVLQRLFL